MTNQNFSSGPEWFAKETILKDGFGGIFPTVFLYQAPAKVEVPTWADQTRCEDPPACSGHRATGVATKLHMLYLRLRKIVGKCLAVISIFALFRPSLHHNLPAAIMPSFGNLEQVVGTPSLQAGLWSSVSSKRIARDFDQTLAPCDSPIYCHGEMLQAIQLARPFPDSKTFVDMPTIRPAAVVLADFATLARPIKNDSALHEFLERNFSPPGTEIVPRPMDLQNQSWTADPQFLSQIQVPEIRDFVEKVIAIWPSLIREYVGEPECNRSNQSVLRSAGSSSATSAASRPNGLPSSIVSKSTRFIYASSLDAGRDSAPTSNFTNNSNSESGLDQCAYSFIPLKHPFVVPGGRFREPYYWDSYWVIEGLLRSGGSYVELARGIIDNFLDLIEQFGFIPNGARIYYLNRSQPPLLTQMVEAYVKHIESPKFQASDEERDSRVQTMLKRAIPLLEKEYDFWMANRSIEVSVYSRPYLLNRYSVTNNQPRPESYSEDWNTVGGFEPVPDAANLYAQLASGAESGWDYSSRWMKQLIPKDDFSRASRNIHPLQSLAVTSTLPVDLNSIMYMNEMSISRLYMRQPGRAAQPFLIGKWAYRAAERAEAMEALFWNEVHTSFFDYNLTSRAQNLFVPKTKGSLFASTLYAEFRATSDFYIRDNVLPEVEQPKKGVIIPDDHVPPDESLSLYGSSLFPFWSGAAAIMIRNPALARQALARVEFLSRYSDGLAASSFESGEQWDEPNVWPPLVHVAIAGALRLGNDIGKVVDSTFEPDPLLQKLALRLAQQYLDATYCTWMASGGNSSATGHTGVMFEKYSSESKSRAGGGGEYEVVPGFGWSNGVLIWIADMFGKDLKLPSCTEGSRIKVR